MRTAIFLGLLFVANAINPQQMNKELSTGSVSFVAILVVAMLVADVFDFLIKNK